MALKVPAGDAAVSQEATPEATLPKRATEYVIDAGMRNHTMIRSSARSSDHAKLVFWDPWGPSGCIFYWLISQ